MMEPDFQNATWVTDGERGQFCFHNPHYPACTIDTSLYAYRIWLAPNAVFLAFYAVALLTFALIWLLTRRGHAFNVALILGLACEVLGYAGRIVSWRNQWDENGFFIQIVCLTIGPAFMAAGVYLCLRRIVSAFGPENSRIPPEYYTRIFIPCDIVSLVLQAVGGAMAAGAVNSNSNPDTGTHIMVAGLSFQVVTMFCFVLCAADFARRTARRHKALGGAAALDQDAALVRMRSTRRFRAFLAGLSLAALCILWRSAFRVAELGEGWTGPVMADQGMFVGFEGVLVVVAVAALVLCHPVLCARPLFEGGRGGGFNGLRGLGRRRRSEKNGDGAAEKYVSGSEGQLQGPDGSY